TLSGRETRRLIGTKGAPGSSRSIFDPDLSIVRYVGHQGDHIRVDSVLHGQSVHVDFILFGLDHWSRRVNRLAGIAWLVIALVSWGVPGKRRGTGRVVDRPPLLAGGGLSIARPKNQQ